MDFRKQLWEVFKINRTLPHNLRTHNEFSSIVPKTVKYRTETISWLGFSPKECSCFKAFNPLSANFTKWSNTLANCRQIV